LEPFIFSNLWIFPYFFFPPPPPPHFTCTPNSKVPPPRFFPTVRFYVRFFCRRRCHFHGGLTFPPELQAVRRHGRAPFFFEPPFPHPPPAFCLKQRFSWYAEALRLLMRPGHTESSPLAFSTVPQLFPSADTANQSPDEPESPPPSFEMKKDGHELVVPCYLFPVLTRALAFASVNSPTPLAHVCFIPLLPLRMCQHFR